MNARTHHSILADDATEAHPERSLEARLQARAFAQAHAAHQDFLVQAYRVLVATMQIGFLLAFAALALLRLPLVVAVAAAGGAAWFQHVVTGRLMQMVLSRQSDVDWSQKRILVLEQTLPPEDRAFTRFKLYQDKKSSSTEERERALLSPRAATEADVEAYFTSHASPSRSKAVQLLDAIRLLGVGVGALGLIASALI